MTNNNSSALDLRMMIYCSLFTALIIIGGYISVPIPISPVPITLADFFVMTAGLLLGFKYGLASVALYISLGFLGMPVFAGGKAGLAVLFGPTGGFLIGYLLAAASIGAIGGGEKISTVKIVTALIIGNILLYAAGVPWLKMVMNLNWQSAITAGITPFIPGIIIKISVASALARALAPRFRRTVASASMPYAEVEDE